MLNWTLAVIISFASAVPLGIVAFINMRMYVRKRQRYLLPFGFTWVVMFAWCMLQGFSHLFMNGELQIASYWTFVPLTICVTLFLDYGLRDRLDPLKLIINAILDAFLLYIPFQFGVANIIVPINFANGEVGLNYSGAFSTIVALIIVYNMGGSNYQLPVSSWSRMSYHRYE